MALGDNLINLRARLGRVKDRFELATTRQVLIVPRDANPALMDPMPTIKGIDARKVGDWLTDEIQILGDELTATGVTRLYTREYLEGSDLLLDATPTDEGYSGKLARILTVADNRETVWTLVIRVIEDSYELAIDEADEVTLTYALDENLLTMAL